MDDNNVECPKCGEVFSLELTRCPQCGLDMYPEDEVESGRGGSQSNEAAVAGAGEALWAVLLGLILAGAVSFIVHMFAIRAGTLQSIPAGRSALGWRILIYLAGPLGALVGGYSMGVVGRRGRLPAAGLGVVVGLGSALLAVLFETRWRLVTPQVIVEPAMLAQYALCLLLGALGGWLNGQSGAAFLAGAISPSKPEVKGMSWEDLMTRDLLTRVRFNRDTAERLIEYERRQAPEADRYTLIRNAVERLERDRRE